MTKLTILRGVSGSGKSSWAESQANVVVVSRDQLRVLLFKSDGPEYYSVDKSVLKSREDYITKVENEAIASALRAGMDVISDNTNVRPRYMKSIAEIGFKAGAEVEVKVFDVRLPVALAAVKHRANMGGRDVPENVIREQHGALQQTKDFKLEQPRLPITYSGTPGKPKAFMVDIDGTLAHMRNHRGPFDWHKVHLDEPDEKIVDLVNLLGASTFALDLGHLDVIVMSGRDEVCREATEKWLSEYIQFDRLFMRPEKDMRKDSIVKAELFDMYVRYNYDVQFVLDDRNQVVDMWRSMGITCLQVAEGDF